MKILFLATLVLGFGLFSRADEKAAAPAEPAKAEAPKADAKEAPKFTGDAAKLKDTMVDLFETSKKVSAPEASEKKKAQVRIEKALDWERIAKDCLGTKRWGAQSAATRKQFKDLLQEVIVRTAFSRLDKFWRDTKKYDIEKIEMKGANAHVSTKFLVDKEDFLLEYFLAKTGGQWLIYDVSYEDLKYSENIAEQISAFMKDNNFNTLLDKLRKRRDELKEDKPEVKKG